MESDSKVVSSCVENSESPCSALLERLKNLRKWQDEQRRELILNQSLGARQVSALAENERKQEVIVRNNIHELQHAEVSNVHDSQDGKDTETRLESPPLESSTVISSTNTLSSGRGFSRENRESVDASSSLRYDESGDGVLSSVEFTKGNPDEGSLPRHAAPSLEYQQNAMSTNVLQNSGEISREEFIPDDEVDVREDDSPELLYESSMYTSDWNPRYAGDPMKKLQGLSNFINRHTGSRLASDDDVRKHDFESNDEYLPSQSKPKFTFLRKGEGTSRFGMKAVRLKPKIYGNRVSGSNSDECNQDQMKKSGPHKGKSLAIDKEVLNITPKSYTSKAGNKPVQKLQLQKQSAKTLVISYSKEGTPGNVQVRPGETSPVTLSGADSIHQKDKPNILESDKQRRKEQEELSAFERLEELAEDSSFSSNSSTVVQLLQRGIRSSTSTPIRSPPPLPHLTTISSLMGHMHLDGQYVQQGASVKLTDRIDQGDIFTKPALHQQNQFPLVNVSQVLEQLKGLVRLEDIDQFVSQEELKQLIESFSDPNTSLPVGSVSYFENNIKLASNNPTSTPAVLQEALPSKPRVHFRPEGVEVLEYELSESEEENTLTETPSIADDTDLITTSDLELLTQVDINAAAPNFENIQQGHSSNRIHVVHDESIALCHEDAPITSRLKSGLQPMKLQFSPPRRPQNSASNYIWSIFGKERPGNKGTQPQKVHPNILKPSRGSSKASENAKLLAQKRAEETSSPPRTKGNENHQEVETYKALLLTKVCELEKEMELYKKQNGELKNLQESMQSEKIKLDRERKEFEDDVAREKKKLRDYVDAERNALWKEKQAVKLQSPSITSVKEQSLEIVYLQEQLNDLQEETKKRESLHQFAVRKLNEKIRMQDEEIKRLKEKNSALQRTEKENVQLKHELDRKKLIKKPVPNNKPGMIPARKQNMKTKTGTISSINKSLDKVAVSDSASNRAQSSRVLPALQRTNSSETVLSNLNPALPQTKSSEGNDNLNIVPEHTNGSQRLPRTNSFDRFRDSNDLRNIQERNELNGSLNKRDKSVSVGYSCENQFEDNGEEDQRVSDGVGNLAYMKSQESPHTAQEKEDSLRSQRVINVDYTELCRDDGTREVIYANGNKKEIREDGSVIVSYYNGDRKEIHTDRTVYVYGTDLTSHTTFTDGREILEFPNGQKETRFSDGSSEIVFTDNTRKTVSPDGTEVCSMKDGTIVHTNPDGIKVFEFVSGQREVHTPEQKRREYPDGTVKILYSDGRTETRYKKGRVRIKDKEGNILTDTHQSVQ